MTRVPGHLGPWVLGGGGVIQGSPDTCIPKQRRVTFSPPAGDPGPPSPPAPLELRLRRLEEELALVKAALADALRRLGLYDQHLPRLLRHLPHGEASTPGFPPTHPRPPPWGPWSGSLGVPPPPPRHLGLRGGGGGSQALTPLPTSPANGAIPEPCLQLDPNGPPLAPPGPPQTISVGTQTEETAPSLEAPGASGDQGTPQEPPPPGSPPCPPAPTPASPEPPAPDSPPAAPSPAPRGARKEL